MSNKPTHEILATVGEYESQGQKKKRYLKCGTAFTNDRGQISLKLEGVPVSPEWSGWLQLFPIERRETKLPDHPTPVVQRAPEINAEDDIPF